MYCESFDRNWSRETIVAIDGKILMHDKGYALIQVINLSTTISYVLSTRCK